MHKLKMAAWSTGQTIYMKSVISRNLVCSVSMFETDHFTWIHSLWDFWLVMLTYYHFSTVLLPLIGCLRRPQAFAIISSLHFYQIDLRFVWVVYLPSFIIIVAVNHLTINGQLRNNYRLDDFDRMVPRSWQIMGGVFTQILSKPEGGQKHKYIQ